MRKTLAAPVVSCPPGDGFIAREIEGKKMFKVKREQGNPADTVRIHSNGIAHDMDNILAAVLANLSMYRKKRGSQEDAEPLLIQAEKGILRLKSLTMHLRSLDGDLSPARRPCSVTSLMKDVAQLCLGPSKTSCVFTLPDDLWPVDADKGLIEQVFHNLILNAEQSMPDGGVIRIRAENMRIHERDRDSRYVRLSIEDEGAGIVREQIPRIFDPCFSTKGVGRGMGLANCLSIVEGHGGWFRVDSRKGKGTVFHMFLPAAVDVYSTKDEEKWNPGGVGQRVLLIDDDEMIRRATEEALAWMGYDVTSAGDGEEGIDCYEQARKTRRPFRAVVLDLTLGQGMEGRATMRTLLEKDPQARVVLFSAHSKDPAMKNYRKMGFQGVIKKPFRLEDLGDTIRKVIESEP